jgi:catechol 2,3-dioxygenase-like lactoylglutathione lyase family enzyme
VEKLWSTRRRPAVSHGQCGASAGDSQIGGRDDSFAHPNDNGDPMDLGTFSISLAVKNIAASKAFYSDLGFEPIAGDQSKNWLILQNGEAKVGLFQGLFDNNIITFNPTDVRAIQKELKAKGHTLQVEADESTTGAAHIFLEDPDGNAILIDQHAE